MTENRERKAPETISYYEHEEEIFRMERHLRRLWIVVNRLLLESQGKGGRRQRERLRVCQSLENPFLLNSGVLLTLRVNVNHQRSKGSRKEYQE